MKGLDRLSRAAYWQLSREEAADIINDYQEMFEEKLSSRDSCSCEFDKPYRVIKCLRNNKQYFIWMSAFSAMIICLLLMSVCLLFREYYFWMVVGLFIFGESLSIFYFQVADRERLYKPCPRGLLSLLFAELILALVVLSVAAMPYIGFNTEMVLPLKGILSEENLGRTLTYIIQIITVIMIVLGVFSLYKAKISDRRWRALYGFGITVVGLCDFTSSNLQSVNLSNGQSPWFLLIVLLVIGGIATGVSLYQKKVS